MAFKNQKEMIAYSLDKPILLVGMMGCGKSSLGRRLAAFFKIEFIDADAEIEKAGGADVSYLFNRFGEEDFRRGEEKVMDRLLEKKRCVIASGGGAFISEKTRKKAKEKAITVFIDADLEALVKNTKGRSHRPLLQTENPKEVLENLRQKRLKYYRQADLRLYYKNETIRQLIRILVSKINKFSKGGKNE